MVPDLPRAPAARGIVVFLHGYGANGNDLIEIGKVWQPLLPDAAFVSPHAPEPCGQAPVGRQWFTLTFRDPNERWIGVQQARPVLERFIDADLVRDQEPWSVGAQQAQHRTILIWNVVDPALIH
jgi:phospholipase/carboxylesterase